MIQCILQGRTLVASIDGEFDLNIADEARAVLDKAIDSAPDAKVMVIDLGLVSFIDSSGAGVLFGRHKRLAARGGRLVIANASPPVARALKLLGAWQLIQVYDSVDRALRGVGEASAWRGK